LRLGFFTPVPVASEPGSWSNRARWRGLVWLACILVEDSQEGRLASSWSINERPSMAFFKQQKVEDIYEIGEELGR
ncbi:hypothetical protein DV515_00013007, partial [Chloebia gouldiae]